MPLASSLTNLIPSDDMQGFMRRIEALESDARGVPALVQQMVGPQIAKIAAAQTTLAAQQASLTTAVANIATLVSQQQTGDVGNESSSGVTLTTSAGSYGVITFTVPAGFTQAQVDADSSMYAGGLVASILRTQIGGVNGIDMYAFTNAAYANAAASFTRKFAVTPGSTFTVASIANTSTGSTTAYITTSASVTYYR